MKQTAVEWLIEQWPILESQLPNWLIEQAKEMEKEQSERMYSEAIEFAEWIRNNPYVWNYPDKLNDTRTTEELFEQFKKK